MKLDSQELNIVLFVSLRSLKRTKEDLEMGATWVYLAVLFGLLYLLSFKWQTNELIEMNFCQKSIYLYVG